MIFSLHLMFFLIHHAISLLYWCHLITVTREVTGFSHLNDTEYPS
mgnify:CR=1 FL=1